MLLYDAHCHLATARWFQQNEAYLTQMENEGSKVICMTCELGEWDFLSQLALKYPSLIIPAFGIHPWKAHLYKEIDEVELTTPLSKFLRLHPIMAIGEVGLDFHPNRFPPNHSADEIVLWKELQCTILQTFLNFAKQHQLPVSVHCVKAFEELKRFNVWDGSLKIALHSFGGNAAVAKEFMHCAYFSFSRLLNSKSLRKGLVEILPMERILIETDLLFCEVHGSELQEILDVITKFKPEFGEEQSRLNFESFLSKQDIKLSDA